MCEFGCDDFTNSSPLRSLIARFQLSSHVCAHMLKTVAVEYGQQRCIFSQTDEVIDGYAFRGFQHDKPGAVGCVAELLFYLQCLITNVYPYANYTVSYRLNVTNFPQIFLKSFPKEIIRNKGFLLREFWKIFLKQFP